MLGSHDATCPPRRAENITEHKKYPKRGDKDMTPPNVQSTAEVSVSTGAVIPSNNVTTTPAGQKTNDADAATRVAVGAHYVLERPRGGIGLRAGGEANLNLGGNTNDGPVSGDLTLGPTYRIAKTRFGADAGVHVSRNGVGPTAGAQVTYAITKNVAIGAGYRFSQTAGEATTSVTSSPNDPLGQAHLPGCAQPNGSNYCTLDGRPSRMETVNTTHDATKTDHFVGAGVTWRF